LKTLLVLATKRYFEQIIEGYRWIDLVVAGGYPFVR
jgi:hypothetical protein